MSYESRDFNNYFIYSCLSLTEIYDLFFVQMDLSFIEMVKEKVKCKNLAYYI